MGKHGKKSKKEKETRKKYKSKKRDRSRSETPSSSSSTSEDEWVEKKTISESKSNVIPSEKRDEWMNITSLGATFSNKDRRKELEENRQKEKISKQYDPKKSIRELNPYWRDGGDGLPSAQTSTRFKKPIEEDGSRYSDKHSKFKHRTSNWRKKSPSRETNKNKKDYLAEPSSSSQIIYQSDEIYLGEESKEKPKSDSAEIASDYLTDKEMNEIAAKIVKAEILGKTEMVFELKRKLERARENRNNPPETIKDEQEVLLTRTDSKGFSKPVNAPQKENYGNKRKKQTVATHGYGKRNMYYPDDDKYSLKNMFENEKFNTVDQQNLEFMKTASKISKSDDMDDLFMDNIRKKESEEVLNRKDRDKAIREHQKISQSLDNCPRCIQSSVMSKHLMVSLGETIYLSLPNYEPLTDGHCLLIPIRHVTCSTQLDENEWTEISDFRKSLTKMFASQKKCVVFYETAINLHSFPHMAIHCVPMPVEQGDLAPIYFKKAIDECEMEWSTNKKLVNMANKDVRRVVPKGLPYFWVSWDMTEGFAHVVEEQKHFPRYFAEEVIGGILDLHHSKWRKSSSEKFDVQKLRVIDFSKNWMNFDCTNK